MFRCLFLRVRCFQTMHLDSKPARDTEYGPVAAETQRMTHDVPSSKGSGLNAAELQERW